MGRLKEVLKFIKENPKEANEAILQLADLHGDSLPFTDNMEFKEELINGYKVYYGLECIKEKVAQGADKTRCYVRLYGVYSLFTKREVKEQNAISSVINAINSKLGRGEVVSTTLY